MVTIKTWKRELAGFLCLLLALGVFCLAASAVLLPKRLDYGATWAMYGKEDRDTVDVMFFGSSLAYCDVAPPVIYQEAGITSYVMAGPEQTMPITYRYVKQALKSQSPKVVFIEATGLLYAEHNRSTKVNITYMPWSLDRLALTLQEAAPQERAGLLFPLASYHSRWTELTPREVQQGLLGYGPDLLAGYTFLEEALPIEELALRQMEDYPDAYRENLECAGKILSLCQQKGVRPIFFVVPSANRPSDGKIARMEADIAALGGEFWDCNQVLGQLGLNLETDFFDTLHFNYRGAEKFSRWLGQQLSQQGMEPTQGEDEALWQQRVEHFRTLRDQADSRPLQLSGAAG